MARLNNNLAALATMSLAQLCDRWDQVYGSAPPRLPPEMIRLGIGYRLQERAGKGLSAAAMRQLRPSAEKPETPSPEPTQLRPGTQLVRTWHGRTITVTVDEDGFRWEGRRYASLTSIAREVTGAAWSGPRFFGLTGAGR